MIVPELSARPALIAENSRKIGVIPGTSSSASSCKVQEVLHPWARDRHDGDDCSTLGRLCDDHDICGRPHEGDPKQRLISRASVCFPILPNFRLRRPISGREPLLGIAIKRGSPPRRRLEVWRDIARKHLRVPVAQRPLGKG